MNEVNPIYEIQQYLRALTQSGYEIPVVIPDGIYGTETSEAVKAFQFLVGLPQTGRVDYATWQALVAAYESAQKNALGSAPIYPFEEILLGGKIKQGDVLPLIYIIQIILRTIGIAYKNLDAQAITGIYDAQTAENVRDFQKINGIPITGEVDRITWDRLAQAYNKYLNNT